ncbi:MAG: hypothetical protein IT303_09620 [Dehalococcoidia bacterium]|nr:hypothetical protein [Dehalococcoidia bacterium]
MTAKEQLIELVEGLSDAEAEAWLVEMRARYAAGAKSHVQLIDEIVASMPPEAFEGWPSSDQVDEVVYASTTRR